MSAGPARGPQRSTGAAHQRQESPRACIRSIGHAYELPQGFGPGHGHEPERGDAPTSHQFSSIAHAHTSLAAPIKAYRINNCGSIKKSRVNEDPENEIYTAVKLRDESMGQNS